MKLSATKLALASLIGIASLASSNQADAHNVDSAWSFPQQGSFFFYHTSPDVGVWTQVGYNGSTPTQYVRTQNGSSITAYIRPQGQCWNGNYVGTYGWVGSGSYRNSPSCSSWPNYSTLAAGRVSINM